MRNKLVLAGIGILAVFAIACGAGSGDTDASVGGDPKPGDSTNGDQGPVTAAIGQTVTLTNTLFDETDTVEITLANPQQFTSAPGSSFFKPDNGVYLTLDVTVACTQGTHTVNPGGFKFVAADGTVYDWQLAVGFDGLLSFTELNAGQRTSGKIVFDVPEAAIAGANIQVDGIGLDFDEPAAYRAL